MPSVRAALASVAAGAVVALACSSGNAFAHAQLESISPSNGEIVSAPPAEVVLTFNEPVSLTGGDARVFHDEATLVSSAPVQSGVTITIPLSADLADGTYTIAFEVVSTDSHRISGASVFHVGAASSDGSICPASAVARSAGEFGPVLLCCRESATQQHSSRSARGASRTSSIEAASNIVPPDSGGRSASAR